MRLIRKNVERVAEGMQAKKLKASGFKELSEVGVDKRNLEDVNLADMTVADLKTLAKEKDIEGIASLNKAELLAVLKDVI